MSFFRLYFRVKVDFFPESIEYLESIEKIKESMIWEYLEYLVAERRYL